MLHPNPISQLRKVETWSNFFDIAVVSKGLVQYFRNCAVQQLRERFICLQEITMRYLHLIFAVYRIGGGQDIGPSFSFSEKFCDDTHQYIEIGNRLEIMERDV